MNKEETIKRMRMIRFHLRNVTTKLTCVGRYSDYTYQAKCERYIEKIDEIIYDLLKDEFDDVR